ncbi:hypothetical protein [Phormidium tenue]|uniref:hypothetical protein n=1 Tax=Phormidium tenue TaxID=126344 RepID=UPI003BB13A7A
MPWDAVLITAVTAIATTAAIFRGSLRPQLLHIPNQLFCIAITTPAHYSYGEPVDGQASTTFCPSSICLEDVSADLKNRIVPAQSFSWHRLSTASVMQITGYKLQHHRNRCL